MRIAVIGGGSAGFLAAANLSRRAPEHALHHIYDSRIPPSGVGEGTLLGLARQLPWLTGLDEATVQRNLQATRKYGMRYEAWGSANPVFIHHFFPMDRAYGYHLSANLLSELLGRNIRGRRMDARVTSLRRVGNEIAIEFDSLPPQRFDFVIDARGFPRELDAREHIPIRFIPTNTAIIRRGHPKTAVDANHAYTRAVARPNGWIFVIPLAAHTSYGYVFNQGITNIEEAERDFDAFMRQEGVAAIERRGAIRFPNVIHRRIYDGFLARIGNAAGFMEPLEASALGLTQLQIHRILAHRLSGPAGRMEATAKLLNEFLVRQAWRLGVFISWHYSLGSQYDSEFWRYARTEAWPRHADHIDDLTFDPATESRLFEAQLEIATRRRARTDWRFKRYSLFPLKSLFNMAAGLGHTNGAPEPPWWIPRGPRSPECRAGAGMGG